MFLGAYWRGTSAGLELVCLLVTGKIPQVLSGLLTERYGFVRFAKKSESRIIRL